MSKQGRDLARTERAAAIRAAQARKERNRKVAVIAGIVVLLCAVIAAGAWFAGDSGDKTSGSSANAAVDAGTTSLLVGKSSAPVKVVIYEDFQCPYCRELESSTRDFLRENAAKGKVYVEYQPINLLSQLPYSAKAMNAWAAVLNNASPNAALKLHDLLFENQPYEQDSGQVTDSQIAAWVKDAGGDNADVRSAMETKDEGFFAAARELMQSKGIDGTPTVFIDDKELPVTSVPDMVAAIEEAVG